MPATPPTEEEKRRKLVSIVNKADTAFMVTRIGNSMHGRPMANAQVEDDFDTLWFATQKSSGKVQELAADSEVCLGYTNGSGSEWASVTGHGRSVENRAKIKQLWNPIWKNWFEGPDDPNLVLIAVTPESAEYWDTGSRALAMFKFAVAAVTGAKMDEGENQRVDVASSNR